MKRFFLLIFCLWSIHYAVTAMEYITFCSPDSNLRVTVLLHEKLYYTVYYKNTYLLQPSAIELSLVDGRQLGVNPELVSKTSRRVSEILNPLYGSRKSIKNDYTEYNLNFKGGYTVVFKVYNDAVAYRFATSYKGEIEIKDETVDYHLATMGKGLIPELKTYETLYTYRDIEEKDKTRDLYLPLVMDAANNIKLAFTEVDVLDYPSLFLRKSNDVETHLLSNFSHYPIKFGPGGYNQYTPMPSETADYIAKTSGTRTFPWRIMVVATNDSALVDNDIVYKLAKPQDPGDYSWVKPGKVMWDWWADYVIENIDFKSGVNTNTYLYHIDFAAKNNIPYIIIDWHWTDRDNAFLVNPEMDMSRIMAHAKEKKVGVILWMPSYTLYRQLDKALDFIAGMGAAGIKVDFFDRDDQLANQMYEGIAKAASKRRLLVDFHGCAKPTGLMRAYPNVLNYEAVYGNENNKWANNVSVNHLVTIPFTRMLAGPMDFTPGGMRNCNKKDFSVRNTLPNVYGTRCLQMAMYVLYNEPLKMFCDATGVYAKEQECFDFLKPIPTTWDDTRVLFAKAGECLVMARKTGNIWYVGGMNGETVRDIEIPLSFLENQNCNAEIFIDGVNAELVATDYRHYNQTLEKTNKLNLHMVPGGGFVIKCEMK